MASDVFYTGATRQLKFSIVQIFFFIAFVAVQIRFVQMQWLGFAICLSAIPVSLIAIVAAALTSESKNGMLNVDDNSAYHAWHRILIFSIVNLVLVYVSNPFSSVNNRIGEDTCFLCRHLLLAAFDLVQHVLRNAK